MCDRYRYSLDVPASRIAKEFGVRVPFDVPGGDVAPGRRALVVRLDFGEREAAWMRWGLIPSWAPIGAKLSNRQNLVARADVVETTPSFRNAWKYKRRCLVIADGYFGTKGTKEPIRIHRPGGKLFAMAGLWDEWGVGQDKVTSFAIVMTEANAKLSELNGRMPVILTTPGQYEQWLTADDVSALLKPAADKALTFTVASGNVAA